MVFDMDGGRISLSALPVSTTLNGTRVEQDPKEWWDKLVKVCRDVTDHPGVTEGIELITVSCSASCLVAVDEDVSPVAPVVMVSDRRASAEATEISGLDIFKELNKKHSILCNVYSQMARMKWFKNNQSDTYDKTVKYLSPNDFIIAKLSGGIFVTDDLNAEKNYYLPKEKRYPSELYEAADLDISKLPEVKSPGTEIGKIDKNIAEHLKINKNARIYVSTYDAICSVFGTGASEPGMVCDVSGTVTSVRMYSDISFKDPKGRVFSQYFSPTDGYLIGGSNNLGGGLIEWAKQCFYKNQESPYEIMENEARISSPKRNGIIFAPHLLGARAPSWDADARGIFFGLERHHTRGDMMRALIESIGFSVKEFTTIFEETGNTPKMVTASGGLARIALANELKANITQLPFHVMDEFESTCLGAAIIALAASGEYSSYPEACKKMVQAKHIYLPTQKHGSYYEDMFELYKKVTMNATELFHERQALLSKLPEDPFDHIENL